MTYPKNFIHKMIVICISIWPFACYADMKELDRIVAIVDDDVITKVELERNFKSIVGNLKQQGKSLPPANILSKKVLDKLIMDKIQMNLAKQVGIRQDETTLNRSIHKMAEKNNLSLTDFISALKEQNIDYEDFRLQIQQQITLSRLQQKFVDSKVIISNHDVDNYLLNFKDEIDANTLYHPAIILFSIPEGASSDKIDELKIRANEVYKKLLDGADFRNTAIEFSDAGNALEGGDLGWRKGNELPSMIAEVTPKLTIGSFSKPIRSDIGFIIVKLLETKNALQHEINETHARHILIKTNLNINDEQAKEHLSNLRVRLVAGEDFAKLSKAHSDDKVSASQGGDLGWFKPGTMVPEFDLALTNLSINEISPIVKTPFGFHLIQVLERRKRDNSDEFIRNKIRENLRQKSISEKKLYWLRQIRDEAHIEIL
ncbi:MAG: peptidylprolyl isomerase [Gammaproteobacteria bacterium]|nr:peptidylprolyl isomerase [Gammaproteobacteria bacterium]